MYCGDETGSFIGEIGSHTCRFGYGGEDNPKLTMPSYVVSNNSKRRMSRFSSLHPPREEEVMESILRMPNSISSISSISSSSSSTDDDNNDNSSLFSRGPITDPNQYLRQGEVVENWDNVQTAWEHSMDTLRATDTLKHTQGGTPYDRTKKQKREHKSSGATSESVIGNDADTGTERGRCVHPILAITPGFSECTSSVGNSSDGDTGPKFQAAIKRQQQTQYTELLMEHLNATSAFLAPAPMLAAFSMGRQTALVVDIGAGGCRVTPIVDGLILKQSQRRSGRGGDWLGDVTWKALLEETKQEESASDSSVGIKPRYMLQGETKKNPYEGKKLPSAHSVFHKRAMNDLMYEIRTEPFVKLYNMDEDEKIRIPFARKRTTSSIGNDGDVVMGSPPGSPEGKNAASGDKNPPGSPESTGTMGGSGEPAIYELPDGTPIDLASSSFGKDLCQLPELLFAEESALPFRQQNGSNSSTTISSQMSTFSNLPLHKLIRESLLSVGDVDARKELAGCICLVGATSLLPNLEKRLSQELTALLPSFVRPKVIAPKISSVERSCASWIGASILTSLGSFQQLWLSRTEYEEYGAALSIQRFP
uniref:Actin-related protein 8 n=1 Tax=Pseudo-nitzschia arenysensis TaxID=697910 RepID=A0A7S0F7S9_9STRA|mmetsp:Transcript_826/g.1934  ORF Transcript_826/g.1934 Transcript_826/m.1934 type:complete len:593 (+) Transcript_826:153-1931(+)